MTEAPGKSSIAVKSTRWRLAVVGLAAGAFVVIYLVPLPEPFHTKAGDVALGFSGKACLGVLVAAVILWLTEALDFAATSLLLLILMPALDITDGLLALSGGEALAISGFADGFYHLVSISFGNRLLFFFLGVFLLSAGFTKSGLGQRLVLWILKASAGSPRRVLFGMLLGGTLISMWVTNMATAALLAPLGAEILKRHGLAPLESNFGKSVMIACCWGPLFGGLATPAGCGPNPIAIAFLEDMAGYTVSFTGWMLLGVPASLLMLPLGWLLLTWFFPPEMEKLEDGTGVGRELRSLGGFSGVELRALAVFAAVILLWIFGGRIEKWTGGAVSLPMEWVAMMGGLSLMFPGIEVMDMKYAERSVPWRAVLLVMASMGLGLMMYETGAARWMAWALMGKVGEVHPFLRVSMVVAAILIIKLFLASNAVTGVIAIPLLITLALDLGLPPWALVAPAAFTTGLGMILVTQSPTNVIPYAHGYFTTRDFLKSGLVMSVMVVVVLTMVMGLWGPLTGMYDF